MDAAHARLATRADAAELARLRWEFRPDAQREQSRDAFLRECAAWVEEALASERWVIAVAESRPGALCGCMHLQCVEKVPDPGRIRRAWGYVTNAYVAASGRGQGIGQQLLELLIRSARERALEFLIVWPSEEAASFYARSGFCAASEVHAGPGDAPPLELVL